MRTTGHGMGQKTDRGSSGVVRAREGPIGPVPHVFSREASTSTMTGGGPSTPPSPVPRPGAPQDDTVANQGAPRMFASGMTCRVPALVAAFCLTGLCQAQEAGQPRGRGQDQTKSRRSQRVVPMKEVQVVSPDGHVK